MALVLSLTLLGCGSDPANPALDLTDANNYYFYLEIENTAQPIKTRTDLTVDWSTLTTDLLGRSMDPASQVTSLQVLKLIPSQSEVLTGIEEDSLKQEDLWLAADYDNEGGTSCQLTDFAFLGTPLDPADEQYGVLEDQYTYMVAAFDGEEQGSRMLSFLAPDDDAPVSDIVLAPDTSSVYYEIDLAAGDALKAGPESPEINWSQLTQDGAGREFALNRIDNVLIGRYDSLTIEELEADFLRIEDAADAKWEVPVPGKIDLEMADLEGWNGWTSGSIWLIALRCTECLSPVPLFVSLVEVTE